MNGSIDLELTTSIIGMTRKVQSEGCERGIELRSAEVRSLDHSKGVRADNPPVLSECFILFTSSVSEPLTQPAKTLPRPEKPVSSKLQFQYTYLNSGFSLSVRPANALLSVTSSPAAADILSLFLFMVR